MSVDNINVNNIWVENKMDCAEEFPHTQRDKKRAKLCPFLRDKNNHVQQVKCQIQH